MTDDRPKGGLTDDQLLTWWLDNDEPDCPDVTDEELSRLLHGATRSLGGGVSMSHDEFQMAMLRMIAEVQRLRDEVEQLRSRHPGLRGRSPSHLDQGAYDRWLPEG